MRIHQLELENIGPFREANIEFIGEKDDVSKPPVIIITGENGTGKTIILDAIRALCNGMFGEIERGITNSNNFLIQSRISLNDRFERHIVITKKHKGKEKSFETNNIEFNSLFRSNLGSIYKNDFIVNYWTSKLSNDSFEVKAIEAPKINNYLDDSLSGIHPNVELTKTITFFDYLSDSKDNNENKTGKKIFSIIKEVIDLSINEGHVSHISRAKLQPVIKIGNNEVTLDKLSSGNLYLIQRFIHLLKQMYSVCVTHDIPIEKVQEVRGLLLIDEAENHLHPKWQKVFIKNILKIFPNLQIIVTTHSPFIVSSVENARVFVCSSKGDYSVINEETDYYANLPIEEILQSPLFNTNSFNAEITELLEKRKEAVRVTDFQKKEEIEKKLLELNPEYFNYFKIDELLKDLSR